MIQIINPSGQVLELYAGTSIPVERNLPLLSDDDKLVQDIVYSAKAPLTENNRIFISNGHLVEAANEVYEISGTKLYSLGEAFYEGNFTYKIVDNELSFTVKINLGAVASYLKTLKVSEIYITDAGVPINDNPGQEAYMKQTVLNHLNYPAIHFPVFNPGWHEDIPGDFEVIVNYWDIPSDEFNAGDFTNTHCNVPYFRLVYVLKQIFKILGFQAEGSFFENDYYNRLCLNTRRTGIGNLFLPTNFYLPDILVGDFLKQVRERLKLNYDVDLMAKKVYIESASDILSSSSSLNLIPYISSVKEISIPDKKGYAITLKVDESDPAMNLGNPDLPDYRPEYTMSIGDASNDIELKIGVLRNNEQSSYNMPVCNQRIYRIITEAIEVTNWQLRLIYFKGMVPVTGGGRWPEALPAQLRQEDGEWYRFLNDCKKVRILARIPAVVLSKLRPHYKFTFKSKEGNLSYAISEKISYSHSNRSSELIEVEIIAMTVSASYNTAITIQKTPDVILKKGTMRYKVYFDPKQDYISEVKLIRLSIGTGATFDSTTVKVPTDVNGVGGDIGYMYQTNNADAYFNTNEFRIYGMQPKQLIFGGRKYNFIAAAGYYYVIPDVNSSDDNNPVWVIF